MLPLNVPEITQQMVAQIMGTEYMEQNGYLEGIPENKLIDVGRDVNKLKDNVERGTKALMDVLSKRYIFTKDFKPLYEDIMVDRADWGGYIEVAKVDYADILGDPAINLESGKDYSEYEHKYYAAKVISKIYNEAVGVMVPQSVSSKAFQTAFNSYNDMGSYISKIKEMQHKTMLKAIDRYGAALVIAAIVISVKGTETAVYLLDEALEAKVPGIEATTTPEDALRNPDYQRFISETISNIRDNMKIDTTAYNNGNITMSSYDNFLYLMSQFVNAYKKNLLAGVFNRDELSFGKFKAIPAWQSVLVESGKKFAWNAVSSVSVAADPENKLSIGTDAVTINNVLGVLFDRYAVGMTVYDWHTTSSYTASADFWTDFEHYLTNQKVDSDFPIVAFINGRKSDSVKTVAVTESTSRSVKKA